MDTKADTISAKTDTNGHEWTPEVDTSYIRSPKWTRMDIISCPFVSNDGLARIQISKGLRAMAFRGQVANQSGEGCRHVVRSSLVVLAGCGIILPTSFQSRKGGDMACVRGPFGACVAIFHNVGEREGSLRMLEAVPFRYCGKQLILID